MEITAIKLALLAQQMRAKNAGADYTTSEPIAIVGMGCRFPGGANSPQAYWQLLAAGIDAISEIPADRWDINALYDPSPDTPGKMTTRWGGFLDHTLDQFDAGFYGLSPREVTRMDPQQRLVLEVAYEAMEDAGQTRESVSGTKTGVFIASYHNDYSHLLARNLDEIDAYSSTGTAHSIVANRFSYLLNLQGPSLAVDTACSSSLVAAHLACQSLRSGESDMAVTGGISLMVTPEVTISLSKWGFMAKDGRCKAFDSRADGFVRGEGCGIIVMKRLSDALADGDRIYALIRGSAVNQDGRSTALTAPNGLAQQSVIRQAVENARIHPDDVSYIEAHGTGTSLGDPIEVEALTAVYGEPRQSGSACVLTSVKTNIGHLEAAAGIAGLIKVALCMQHGQIPAHLHFRQLNPHISLEGTPFVIPIAAQPWLAEAQPRLAGISGFGFGGTNAHVIMEEAPAAAAQTEPETSHRPFLLPISAQTPQAVRDLARAYQSFLASPDLEASLTDICYTASQHRTHETFNAAVVGSSAVELAERMGWIADGTPRPGASAGQNAERSKKLVFVFSGQGPQWWGMGRELLAQEPVFRELIEKADSLLGRYANWSLLEELKRPEAESRFDQTEIAQPAIFALQIALAGLWQSWGIEPAAVIGHSVGEIAAAYTAGILTLEDAIRVVYHRSRLMQRATGYGKMAAVDISAEDAAQEISHLGLSEKISIAAINAPASITVSGEEQALETFIEAMRQKSIPTHLLRVNYAFHSPQMDLYREELIEALAGLAVHPAALPIISTVTGALAAEGDYSAEYWARNIRYSVQFAGGMQHLIEEGYTTFLEISPHPVLASSITACLKKQDQAGLVLASLRRGQVEIQTLFNALAELAANHFSVQWDVLYPEGEIVSLPSYPWQRQRYWFDPKPAQRSMGMANDIGTVVHPLLGKKLRSPAIQGSVFEAQFSADNPPFLGDHRIYGNILVPGTAYLEMILAVIALQSGDGPCTVADFGIEEALAIPDHQSRIVQCITHLETQQVEIFSFEPENETWKQHASARFALQPINEHTVETSLEALRGICDTPVPVETFYARIASLGIYFGGRFHGMAELWRSAEKNQVLAHVCANESVSAEMGDYRLHPALLDACFQTLGAAFLTDSDENDAWLPVGVESFHWLMKPTGDWWCHAVLQLGNANADLMTGDLYLYDETESFFAVVHHLKIKRASRSAFQHLINRSMQPEALYALNWLAEPLPESTRKLPGSLVIFADHQLIGANLMHQMDCESLMIFPGPITSQTGANQWDLDVTSKEDFRRILDNWQTAHPVNAVAYLWNAEVTNPSLWEIGLQGFLHLVQTLSAVPNPPRLFMVTTGAQGDEIASPSIYQAPAWGLARTVQLEHPELHCTCIDLDPSALPSANARRLAAEILANSAENQILYRDDHRLAARLETYQPAAHPVPVHLDIAERGILDNLKLTPKDRRPPLAGEVEIRVYATGINFRDVLNALGMYPGDPGPLGGECAGVITAVGADVSGLQIGDAVLGIATDSFSTYVNADARLLVHKPANLTFAQAASIPSVFLTAYYGLHNLAHIKAGDRILIHAAAGGVGMAAVQLARRAGAIIFGTAGNPEKRALIHSQGVEYVFDSRSLEFSEQVQQITNGEGVDIVLNSLAGDFISHSVACLKESGCFLEIGKRDLLTREQFAAQKPSARYYVYDLVQVFRDDAILVHTALEEIVNAITSGDLRLLPVHTFPLDRAEEAFRYMAQAKHTGKLVLTQPLEPSAAVTLKPDAAYLITGAFGGLGPKLAESMVTAGARHIALLGRHAPSPEVQAVIEKLCSSGTQIEVLTGDVSDAATVANILKQIQANMPPLKGIIHAAGTLDDGILEQQTWARFAPVFAPKVLGAITLHEQTIDIPLDFFILFSSASAVIGSAGQANYAAANAFLDTFAQWRTDLGYPTLSIGWGSWGGSGMAARLSIQDQQRFSRQGLSTLSPEQGADILLRQLGNNGHLLALPFDWNAFVQFYEGRSIPPLYRTVTSSIVTKTAKAGQSSGSDIRHRLSEAPQNRRRPLLQTHLREQAIRVLGLSGSSPLDTNQPLRELGLDSLMAVELRNAISASMEQRLPSTLLFDFPTIAALTDYLTGILWPETHAPAESQASTTQAGESAVEIQNLSDEEAEAQLLAELEKPRRK